MEWGNLDLCQLVVKEIIGLKQKYGFETLVHCGDVKRQYNPIDIRVANMMLRIIGKLREAGIELLVDLGNHDRVGMHVDTQNWLPILRKGGARCFDKPGILEVAGARLFFGPYRRNGVEAKRELYDLARRAGSGRDILVFHADIKSARYNATQYTSDEGLEVRDFYPQKYVHCIGGHIHMQQNVGKNIWYVGSPFATDWGEANQKKGYLLYDTETSELKRIRSQIPGWFDPDWPGFWEPQSWVGARVRIKVPVGSSKHIQEELRNAQKLAEKKYEGAEIVVVPVLEKDARSESAVSTQHSDKKKIELYAQQTLPDELKMYRQSILKYLSETLNQVGGLTREGGELKFTKIRCHNMLSFKELEINVEPGLTVVTGINKDRKGKSNGSGKTSYLQPIAIGICGTTFKEQKHDAWMNRWKDSKEPAWVRVWMEDARDRKIMVRRGRQPVGLELKINGEQIESGNRPEETQKLIEQVTGYTWETLSNALYIDQSQAHLMLSGTEAQRKTFLARLQNLERFERALKRVRDEKVNLDYRYTLLNSGIAELLTDVSSVNQSITDAKGILAPAGSIGVQWKRKKRSYLDKKDELLAWKKKGGEIRRQIDRRIAQITVVCRQHVEHKSAALTRRLELQERIEKFENLEGSCPMCWQPVDEQHMATHIKEWKQAIAALEIQAQGYDDMLEKSNKRLDKLKSMREEWAHNRELEEEINILRVGLETIRGQLLAAQKQKELLDRLRSRKERLLEQVELKKEKIKKVKRWLNILKYAETVFARTGIPAFLNAQLCPQLNEAAEKYSELFTQREIQVHFAVDDEGRTDVQVINAHGGEYIEDQSEGEMKVASLITSFAVREIAPKTNLLILDEPGDGLDAPSARQFARGLKEVSKQFGTIWLTSHNPEILSELASERLVTIVKENGISRVAEETV
jgi:DNA repair exonuclease SbcCD nuclease subunit